MDNTKAVHWILGVALLMIGVFVVAALVMVNSQASDVTTSATIANSAPTAGAPTISATQYGADAYPGGTINDLVSASSKTIYIHGVVADDNGEDDLSQVDVLFYRTGAGDSCSADENDCYQDDTTGSCDFDTTHGDGLQAKYSCSFSLIDFIDGTDAGSDSYSADNWTVKVTVTDVAGGLTGTNTSKTIEMETHTGITHGGTVNFGSLALDYTTTTADDQALTITQNGNDTTDLMLSSTAFTCDELGTIPAANLVYKETTFNWADGTAMSGTPTDFNFNMATRTEDGADLTQDLFLGLKTPQDGARGTCTATTTITAKAAD